MLLIADKYKRKLVSSKGATVPERPGLRRLSSFALGFVRHTMNTSTNDRLPRIAASSYLNTAPLIWSFINGPKQDAVELFTHQAPARCAEMLASGEVDAALVPVIEYQRIPDIAIIPDVCVGSRSAVRSVVIASKLNNLKKVKRIALDDSSRTSVALVKIIFREFLGFEPEWQISPPDLGSMLEHNDAALIIGDPAMKIPRDKLRVFDLATLWHDFTGFGFVFAMWMAGTNRVEQARAIDFKAVRDEGLAHLDEIAARHEEQTGLSRGEIRDYLTLNIAFQMDDEMKKGLALYFELAQRHGLAETVRTLEFMN